MVSRIVEILQIGVQVRADELDVAQQLGESLQRVVLALDRDQHLLASHQSVDRQQPQRGRAVDEDVVHRVLVDRERALQPALPGHHGDELDLGAGEVDGRRGAVETGDVLDRLDDLLHAVPLDQHVVDRGHLGVVLDAERGGGVALRVEVDHEHLGTELRERGGDIDRRGGLADAALLVGHDHRAGTRRAGQRLLASRHRGDRRLGFARYGRVRGIASRTPPGARRPPCSMSVSTAAGTG
jgi:hypothetical protein